MTRFKKVLIILGALVLLLVIGVGVFIATFDPNAYKDQITELVQEKTGRTLTLTGDIALSVFPWLGLSLGEAELSNAPGFDDRPFAAVQAVRIHVALLPLLRREIRVDQVELRGLRLNLARDASGRTNWEDLTKPPAAEAPAGAPPSEPGAGEAGPPPLIYVAGAQLVDAHISWNDAQTGQSLTIDPLNLRTGELEFGSPTPVSLDLRLVQEKPPREVKLELEGDAVVDPEQGRYRLGGLRLTTVASGEGVPGGSLEALLQGELAADLPAQTASARSLKLSALGIELGGEISVTGLTSQQKIAGQFATQSFSPRDVLDALGVEIPKMQDSAVLKKASLAFDLAATASDARISGLQLMLDDTQATGEATVANFAKPAIDFKLAVDAIDVDRYTPEPQKGASKGDAPAAAAPPLGLPVDLLRQLDVDGRMDVGRVKVKGLKLKDIEVVLSAHDGLVAIKPLELALYGGRFKSDAKVDVRGEKPVFGLRQDLFEVNFGELLSDLVGDSLVTGQTKLSASLDTRGLTPKELLKQLDGDLSFAFTDGAVKGEGLAQAIQAVTGSTTDVGAATTEFRSITGTARIDSGILKSDNLKLLAPKFEASGAGQVDLAQELVDYTLKVARPGKDSKGSIPIRIAGSYDDLKFAPDLTAAAKEKAQKVLEKQLDKLAPSGEQEESKPTGEGDVKETLEKGLKGLFR